MNQLRVKNDRVANYVADMTCSSYFLKQKKLLSMDQASTITANRRGQMEFENAQSILKTYAESLQCAVDYVSHVNEEFREFDELMSNVSIVR